MRTCLQLKLQNFSSTTVTQMTSKKRETYKSLRQSYKTLGESIFTELPLQFLKSFRDDLKRLERQARCSSTYKDFSLLACRTEVSVKQLHTLYHRFSKTYVCLAKINSLWRWLLIRKFNKAVIPLGAMKRVLTRLGITEGDGFEDVTESIRNVDVILKLVETFKEMIASRRRFNFQRFLAAS